MSRSLSGLQSAYRYFGWHLGMRPKSQEDQVSSRSPPNSFRLETYRSKRRLSICGRPLRRKRFLECSDTVVGATFSTMARHLPCRMSQWQHSTPEPAVSGRLNGRPFTGSAEPPGNDRNGRIPDELLCVRQSPISIRVLNCPLWGGSNSADFCDSEKWCPREDSNLHGR